MVVHTHLNELTDDTQAAANNLLAALTAHGLNPIVEETFRTQARQNYLYENFGPDSSHKKTTTRNSWHTAGRALDISISPATLDNILFFLDTANALGFTTIPNATQVRRSIAQGVEPNIWD